MRKPISEIRISTGRVFDSEIGGFEILLHLKIADTEQLCSYSSIYFLGSCKEVFQTTSIQIVNPTGSPVHTRFFMGANNSYSLYEPMIPNHAYMQPNIAQLLFKLFQSSICHGLDGFQLFLKRGLCYIHSFSREVVCSSAFDLY